MPCPLVWCFHGRHCMASSVLTFLATWTKRSGSRLHSEVGLQCPPGIKKDFAVYKCDLDMSGLTSLWVIMKSHKYKHPKDSDTQPQTAYLGHQSSHSNPQASPGTPWHHQVSGISLAPHPQIFPAKPGVQVSYHFSGLICSLLILSSVL